MSSDSFSFPRPTPVGSTEVGTARSRAADEVVARLERLPFTRFHLHMVSMLGVGTFFDAFDSLTIGVALTVVFRTMHIGFVNAGLLLSGATAGQFVGAWVFGSLAEWLGRKTAFVLALGLFGALSIGAALAWNFQSLFAFRLVQGLGLGGEVPIAMTLLNESIRGQTRGKVSMAYESVYVWGIFLAPLIGLGVLAWLPSSISWRVLFLIGAIPLLVAIYAFFRLPESPRWLADKGRYQEADQIVSGIEASARQAGHQLAPPQVRYRADIQPTNFAELLSPEYRQRTVVAAVQQFTTFFVNSVYLFWFPTLFITLAHVSRNFSLTLTVITGAVQVVLAYIIAMTVDQWGRIPYFKLGFSLAALGALFGLVFVSVFHLTSWPVLFVSGLLMIVGGLFTADIGTTWIPELYPTRMRAWAGSTLGSINRIASVISPIVTGVLLTLAFGKVALFILLTVTALIGLVVIWFWGVETKQRVLEEISA